MFKYAAAYYLWFWLTVDMELVRDINEHHFTTGSLDTLFKKYRVHRTFKGSGPERLNHCAAILNEPEKKPELQDDMIMAVQSLTRRVAKIYEKNCLSAVSKALWMRWQHPVIIYDGNALRGLKLFGFRESLTDYCSYYHKWIDFFNRTTTQAEVDAACAWLPTSHYARSIIDKKGATQDQIDGWVKTDWFRNRIVDIRLWIRGTAAGDAVSPADLARLLGPGEVT